MPPSNKSPDKTSSPSSSPPPSSSSSSWAELAAREEAEALASAAAESQAKPYSTPPGFKAPSLGEQFAYAARRHPYARLGYAAVFLTGCGVWWLAGGSGDGGSSSVRSEKGKDAGEKVASGAKR